MLEKQIVNRKTFINKNKVSWLATKEMLLKKDKEFSIFMKTGLDGEFQELDIMKKNVGNQVGLTFNVKSLVTLWPQGKEIAQAKFDDIKSMMHLISAAMIFIIKLRVVIAY
ncbi:unnamed protein product [Arctia plantaginis]|uniref:Uncharacterized protein n=1 Tax=Arctia plantaginis TaxID=874455 RepID=A0A8S1BCD8_ARCPL|nr:unnamed protein product [Arctia plantaginis]